MNTLWFNYDMHENLCRYEIFQNGSKTAIYRHYLIIMLTTPGPGILFCTVLGGVQQSTISRLIGEVN